MPIPKDTVSPTVEDRADGPNNRAHDLPGNLAESVSSITHSRVQGSSCFITKGYGGDKERPSYYVNRFMLVSLVLLALLSVIGCWATSLKVHGVGTTLLYLVVLIAAFAPVPAYWHQKGWIARRDTSLTIVWCLLTWFFIAVPFLVGARLNLPLRDNLFVLIDRSLGFDGPALVAWASHHQLGSIINSSYNLLIPYLEIAIVVPSLLGKRESSRFVLANTIALAIGLTLFALFPAIGPWHSEQVAVGAMQVTEQNQLFELRGAMPYTFTLFKDGAGIVEFPSFHVIWAVLAASALWGFRYLRVPLVVLSTMIVISTMTSGWHYLTDVLCGIVVVSFSLWAASIIQNKTRMRSMKEQDDTEAKTDTGVLVSN